MKALLIAILLAGCTMRPNWDNPDALEVPRKWHSTLVQPMDQGSTDCFNWWESLEDCLLNKIIEYSLCHNLDMRIAEMRVQMAQNQNQIEFLQYAWQETWMGISADIAKNYIELRGLQQRLKIMERIVDIQNEIVALNSDLRGRGIVDDIDLSNLQADWHITLSQRTLIEAGIARAIHHLSVLSGNPPGDLSECLKTIGNLPKLPREQPIGSPCDLLCRRPDIRKAAREYELKPSWEAFYNYQKSVLTALEESENAISSYRLEGEHLTSLIDAYQKYHKAVDFSHVLLERGINDILNTAKVKKAVLSSEDAVVQSRVALLLYYVELYKALGVSACAQDSN